MKKFFGLLLLTLLAPTSVLANAELVQIVNFKWDAEAEQLKVLSFGSGTAIAKDLVITNKHVVKVGSETGDFVLLCPAQTQVNRAVECNVPAGVSVLHNTLDVALVRTLDPKDFLPSVRTSTAIKRPDDVVRVVGFPVAAEGYAQNFGDTKTVEAFEAWQADPASGLSIKGDTPTTTRGKAIARYRLEGSGALLTKTDAKVNFGNSGGAAFDQFGEYIGIPTLKDSEGNSYILEYAQLHDWVNERSSRQPRVDSDAYTYYKTLIGFVKKPTTSTTASTSSRYQYLKQLAAKRRAQGSSSRYRTTTTRYYGSPYSSRSQ